MNHFADSPSGSEPPETQTNEIVSKVDSYARPLQYSELPPQFLHFVALFGQEGSKRHSLQLLEHSHADVHGGILLMAVGNSAKILTLAPIPMTAPNAKSKTLETTSLRNVVQQESLLGQSGSGVSCIAVHASKQWFAIAEKGIKPMIHIYQYPAKTRCNVLQNGTECSYNCIAFSSESNTFYLASLGSLPDCLLTVWNWKSEQIVLRCKAFGQEVFNVVFAPKESGFLTTSGVGHIRFWKMATTFTGLKLQGELGKFGKSELSDVEAFCVLPNQKILSGTETGILHLWEGQFIKAELYTYPQQRKPHNGAISVVQYDASSQRILSAGRDGYIRFWAFSAIEQADMTSKESIALVPILSQILVRDMMNIRAVLEEGNGRFLVQEGNGCIHQILLVSSDEEDVEPALDQEDPSTVETTEPKCDLECKLTFNYIPNITGVVNGIACSPYEHLAATSGEDGSVRAWNYMEHECLFLIYPEQKDANPSATCIVWVPKKAAYCPNANDPSRQVVVGYSDGVVRVFLMDLDAMVWIRTNVFKPHQMLITCLSFSPSGAYLATASEDATIFFFFIKHDGKELSVPEYMPVGYQRMESPISSLSWRNDHGAVLLTEKNGAVLELELLNSLLDTSDASGKPQRESYELQLRTTRFEALHHFRHFSMQELEALAPKTFVPGINESSINDKVRRNFQHEYKSGALACCATYDPNDPKAFFLSCLSPNQGMLFHCEWGNPVPLHSFASEDPSALLCAKTGGNTSASVTSLHHADIVAMKASISKRLLLCGLSNGKYQLRSSASPHAFLTGEFHDIGLSNQLDQQARGVCLDVSWDDTVVLATGSDGVLSIVHIDSDEILAAAEQLELDHKEVLAAAQASRQHATELQQKELDAQNKPLETRDERFETLLAGGSSTPTEIASLAAFHGARAYANCIEEAYKSQSNRGTKYQDCASTFVPEVIGSNEQSDSVKSSAYKKLEVPDLQNSNDACSIEGAKLKTEAEIRRKATESRQEKMRAAIEILRQEFQELQELDRSYAPEHRLDPSEWDIDIAYAEVMRQNGEETCKKIRHELCTILEEENEKVARIRDAFLSNIAVELVTLHGFRNDLTVQTFRTTKLRRSSHQNVEKSEAVQSMENHRVPGTVPPSVLSIVDKSHTLDDTFPLLEEEWRLLKSDRMSEFLDQSSATSQNVVNIKGHKKANVYGFHARKEMRAARKSTLEKLLSNKPGEDADDPRDLVAIAYARRNLGDYKLKSDDDYVVPENQRVNATKKKAQMALLEEKMYSIRIAFSAKVLELRKLKSILIEEIQQDHETIQILQESIAFALRQLRQNASISMKEEDKEMVAHYEVDPREWPELREHVTQEEIEQSRMETGSVLGKTNESSPKSFKSPADRLNKPQESSISKSTEFFMESLAAQTSSDPVIVSLRSKLGPRKPSPEKAQSNCFHVGEDIIRRMRGDAVEDLLCVRHLWLNTKFASTDDHVAPPMPRHQKLGSLVLTTLHCKNIDTEDLEIRIRLMEQETIRLRNRHEECLNAFDKAVEQLRMEKVELDLYLKECELRLYTQWSELQLLQQFESRENQLTSKLEKSTREMNQILKELNDIQDLIHIKRKDMEEWNKEEKQIHQDFLLLFPNTASPGTLSPAVPQSGSNGPQHPHFLALQKIFKKKKFKRPKKKVSDGVDRASNSGKLEPDDDEDSDYDMDDSEYDDDDDDDDDGTCPSGCDLSLYDKVLALRERRADIDDVILDLNRVLEELKKNQERQIAKQRQIDKDLQATGQDIQLFQTEKQIRCNELDVGIALDTQHIRCLSYNKSRTYQWTLNESASSWLVFPTTNFQRLSNRIERLQFENKCLREQFRDLHRQQSVLSKEKTIQQQTIATIQDKCVQLQLLKFGQLIDMDLFDKACDVSQLNELQERVRIKEMEIEREALKMKRGRQDLALELLKATQTNTELLGKIAALNKQQFDLEKELNQLHATQQQTTSDDQANLEREIADRNKLMRLAKLQARELDGLRQEIRLLRCNFKKIPL
uniref:Avirulenceassociated protein 3.4FA putative n=1 Tax=Albugo laibachii Nc14 TaxID=890382 RepID=F0WBG6_9STRA|nr:avirulenceassociated protein 3.4FA putative [Albugo laibachii Nc14]|eukprot:CCA18492.1 avirulenceassociated protein 3.4FA putative [Albugo laibachii Nc14]